MVIPVDISDRALEEVREILANKNIPKDYGLRIGIKGSRGCAGVSFMLGFDKCKDDDMHYQLADIDVYISKKELMFLAGKKVDFYEGSDARGFVFNDAD
ncbi:MAG: iron-sulfur cluster assembly accessory protein [Cyclobacteriaceae bacterium]|nr:iron-sulfur cluster assembly accessory protein [Cyclobacteriaceae bacterium HetDA_MAG_MS6]